jgi:hypothetical protein
MHNRAKQPNIPAELADNLIDSLGDLTAIEGFAGSMLTVIAGATRLLV